MQVYLNGTYLEHDAAVVPVDDRGFLFADGVYEVIRVYRGTPFLMEPHVARMRAGLRALQIDGGCIASLPEICSHLLDVNDLTGGVATIYVQVTRGAAPRQHAFPACTPTVFAAAKRFGGHPAEYFSAGIATITVPDNRWSRCDIKSIALLPNVLANQAAHAAGAFEALFVKDGVVIEGSHSNLFGVLDGELITYPRSNYILAGITRAFVLDLAHESGIPAREAPIYWEDMPRIEELFLSGTTTDVMPIATVDGQPVGSGAPGPVTRRLMEAFRSARP
jgi:D-alanine transaminase